MARFLRDKGVNAHVLLFEGEFDHFHPSSDAYDTSYQSYCVQLDWGSSKNFLQVPKNKIKQDLEPYQVLIGCGLAPAFCQKISRRLNVFRPYGDDIWTETFYRMVNPIYLPSVWSGVYHQRVGIRNSEVIHMSRSNELYEQQYEKYKGNSVRWAMGSPMVYTGIYAPDKILQFSDRTHWAHEFKKIRQQCELMIISHSRHVWDGPASDPNQKGNDKLIRGFAHFLKRNPGTKATLVTLEYGKSVLQSRQLIKQLEIEHAVWWMPKMLRKDLMIGLALADIACGEFVNSWLMGGVMFEALALAKPLLGYREDKDYLKYYSELYPMMNVTTSDDIVIQLEAWMNNPQKFAEMGEKGRCWYEDFVVKPAVEKYLQYLSIFSEVS